jgi:hypothetical protein
MEKDFIQDKQFRRSLIKTLMDLPLFRVTRDLSIASAERAINHFEKTGHSSHSINFVSLGIILRWCETNKIPYTLRANPGAGYFIKIGTEL